MEKSSVFSRTLVYSLFVIAAVVSLGLVAAGQLSFLTWLGLFFGLTFLGLFVTHLRTFILVYIATRGLLEAFLEPTRIFVGGFSIQMIGVLGAIIFFGGFIYIVINRVKVYEVSVVGPMLIFLTLALPTTLLLSPDKVVGFKDWIGTASAVVLFILIASLFSRKKEILLLLSVVILSSVPPLVVGFYQAFTGSGNLNTAGFNRIYGTFSHPNSYAIYLGMLLLLCIPMFMDSRIYWKKGIYAILCGAIVMSLILTYARAPWLAFLVSLGILAVVRYRRLLVFVPLVVILLLIFVPSILARFEEAMGFSQGQGSLFFRVEMWRYLLPKFTASPISGNGLGSFAFYAETGMGRYYLPHNDYMRLLVDTGIIGLASYLAALVGLAKGAIRSYLLLKDEQLRVLALVFVTVLVAYFLGSITENLFRAGTTQTYFWTLAGIVAAAARTVTLRQEGSTLKGQLSLASMEV